MRPRATSPARLWLCVSSGASSARATRASPSSCGRRETVIAYLRAIRDGSERRYIGHNPAGGAMIVVLLAAMAATAVSGWLLTTDAFWGSTIMQHVHSALAHGVLALVVVHLVGVAIASLRHHENLVRAMVVGVKRAAGPGDVA